MICVLQPNVPAAVDRLLALFESGDVPQARGWQSAGKHVNRVCFPPAVGTYSIEDIRDVIASEGFEYALTSYLSPAAIEDKDLARTVMEFSSLHSLIEGLIVDSPDTELHEMIEDEGLDYILTDYLAPEDIEPAFRVLVSSYLSARERIERTLGL